MGGVSLGGVAVDWTSEGCEERSLFSFLRTLRVKFSNRKRWMMKRFSSIRMVVVLVAAVALLGAACSSDDSSDTTAAATATEASEAPGDSAVESAIVKEVQTALAALEYYTGPIDGIYGPGTTSAIEAFQKDAGITVDGKYGPQTHDALEEAAEEAEFDWDKYAAIKELQIEMADLGYYNGEIDGEYGPQTEDAIRAVQADCGITQDGIYGPDTHSCLLDLGGDA
jgi:peptidoglycan hydrolase-like protein with peptidoglycan-binding domain